MAGDNEETGIIKPQEDGKEVAECEVTVKHQSLRCKALLNIRACGEIFAGNRVVLGFWPSAVGDALSAAGFCQHSRRGVRGSFSVVADATVHRMIEHPFFCRKIAHAFCPQGFSGGLGASRDTVQS